MINNEAELKAVLGINVKIRRESLNLSQEKLAEKISVSKNTISDIETGQKFARADTLVNLAKTLETDVYELFKPDNVYPDNAIDIITKYHFVVREAMEKLEKDFMENLRKDANNPAKESDDHR